MNDILFPKPPPAKPILLEKWLRKTDRAESGREAFFRGRDSEYEVFRSALMSLDDGIIGGGTMIFQGAPGAGKSALMKECMEAVRLHSTPHNPWVAVDIHPGDLSSSVKVMASIFDAVNIERERLLSVSSSGAALQINKLINIGRKIYRDLATRGFGISGFFMGGQSTKESDTLASSKRVFEESASALKNFHIVVFVDEAQNTPINGSTKNVMRCLQDPPADIPLVAAFFGLSNTRAILRDCGLSRLADERVITLGQLSHVETVDAIRSMFDSYGFFGELEHREIWIERLAELSQGWPQHINRASVAAVRVLAENGGLFNNESLHQAIDYGRKRKDFYYFDRLETCFGDPAIYKRLALAARVKNGILSRMEIDRLTQSEREKLRKSTDEFLNNALHAGLLMSSEDLPYHYRIPIPSFGDYLCNLPVE